MSERVNRRNFLQLAIAGCLALLAGCAKSKPASMLPHGCVVRPEQTEGPYYVDTQLERADIRSDPATGEVKEGVPLALTINVTLLGQFACEPLAGAVVDVWHCDAQGVYYGVNDRMLGRDLTQLKFLRGFQKTDAKGAVQFVTIIPGWYSGRTTHIHFKIRTQDEKSANYEFTSQLYFDDAFAQQVYQQGPYVRTSVQDTRNSNDFIFRDGGEQLLLKPEATGQGFRASFDITLDLTDADVGKPDGMMRGGNRGSGGRPPGALPPGPPPANRP